MASPMGSEDEVSAPNDCLCKSSSQPGDLLTDGCIQIFEALKRKVDPKVEEERIKAANERERAYLEKNLRRLEDLVRHDHYLSF